MAVDTWTFEKIERLRALYAEGLSCSMIAADMGEGISRNSVIGKVHRLGLNLRGAGTHQKVEQSDRKREPREHKPKVRIVRENSNSTELRVIQISDAALAELRCIEVASRGISLLDLEPDDCRYPYGDSPFTFCGHPKLEGSSYCPEHFALTKSLPSDRRAVTRIQTVASWRAA